MTHAGCSPYTPSPIARLIAESLRPLRDFFTVMFFFALGAGCGPAAVPQALVPAAILAAAAVALKPIVFRALFVRTAESPERARSACGWVPMSELSLLVAFIAEESGLIRSAAASVVQLATIVTFVASTCWIVLRCPSPMALSDALRRD